jgi:alkylation response protein AidB-like acyl-CoA dehydrogenase
MQTAETTVAACTASDVSDAVARLVPTISARASEIEAARRLPDDLLAELRDTGCLRMLLPASHGGLGVTLPNAMRVYEALSRADASVAWTVANCSGAWCDFAGLDRAAFDTVFSGGIDVTVAGVFAPCGVAERVDGGYRVSGRWGFASGCQHCDWLFGNCLEDVDGERRMRTVVFAASEITIEDTWTVSGLCGTGSHHFTAHQVFVPITRTCATLEAEPCVDVPLVRIPTPPLFALAITSTALGVAQGALDDILAMARGKTPMLAGAPLAANPLFQYQLANADTELRAARGLAYEEARSAWEAATDRTPFTMEHRARIRATAAWATARATAVVDFAYHAGGGSALYAGNTLQRRMRDIHAITQHFLIKPDTLTTVGAVLAGQDVDLPVF